VVVDDVVRTAKSGWSLPGVGDILKGSMPFPLAHPAAVLLLRRYCPRYLSFPALVIGSLSPDVGYFSGRFRLGEFSHRLLPGSFGFCLPVGLVLVLVFYIARLPVVGILPSSYRRAFRPLCQRPVASPFVIVVSVLIGAWTHLFLDSITHPDGWLVKPLPVLQAPVLPVGQHRLLVCEVLYAGCTFAGVAWLAFCYLRWLEKAAGSPVPTTRGMKWGCALLLASSILFIALASRNPHPLMGIVPAGIIAVLLVIVFLLVTGRSFGQTRSLT
jgi:hypothetical protein